MATTPGSAYIYAMLDAWLLTSQLVFLFVELTMSGGSSRGKGKGKETPFLWEGSLGPDLFEEALYDRFFVESKSDFTKEAPPRGYDDRREEWPKYMHGEDCLVQMFTDEIDGGHHFFKCPRAWVIDITICCINMLLVSLQLTRHTYCSLLV
jgi:hypothetical protein